MSEGEHEPKRRQTRQGRLVHEAVSRFDHHPTAKEVHQALEGEGVGLATVYRQLARLVDDGMLGAVDHMGETRYDTNLDPHAHAVCNGCGDIWDVPLPTILPSMLTPKRLATVEDVDLTFRGLCPACA